MTKIRIGYLVKKFPRLSETFVLGEILGQETLGANVHVFSRRAPDDEPRHPQLESLRASVEVLPSTNGMQSWLELFRSDPPVPDLMERMGALVRQTASWTHPRLPMLFAEALYLLRRTRELRIEHVHAHFATDSALVAMLLSELGGPGYSVTAHAKDIYRSTVDVELLDRMVSRSRFTVTVCDANVRHLEALLSLQAQRRLRRIYNGIDLDTFRYRPGGREDGLILATGRLVEKKGFHVLLEALRQLRAREVAFEAVIIGEGDERERLERIIAELELGDHVRLLGGQDQTVLRGWMERATVHCLPCLIGADGNRDALPTVLLEALASGLPSVSTPVTGIPEILANGDAGRIVPENDPERTADALHELLADPTERSRIAEAGRGRARALFDREKTARDLHDCFIEAVTQAACA